MQKLKISVIQVTFTDLEGVLKPETYFLGNRNSIVNFEKAKVFTDSEVKKFKYNSFNLIDKYLDSNPMRSSHLRESYEVKVSAVVYNLTSDVDNNIFKQGLLK